MLLPLHNIYADYRNHPTFFRKMERFIRAVLSYRVQFEQPRLWSTKGETLRAFLDMSRKVRPASDEYPIPAGKGAGSLMWAVGGQECGLCAACLLKHFSLHAAGINEAPGTYVVSDLAASDATDALYPHSPKG